LPKEKSMATLKAKLSEEKIYVSYRGKAIRVSPNVYNSESDMEKLAANLISI